MSVKDGKTVLIVMKPFKMIFGVMIRVMVFNATFNNISVISWWSVLLVEETTDLSQVTNKLHYIMLYQVHLAWVGFKLTKLVVIDTDCIDSYKSNYHAITTMMTPLTRGKKTNQQKIYIDFCTFIYFSKRWQNCSHCDETFTFTGIITAVLKGH
jgi:hypothetical protein